MVYVVKRHDSKQRRLDAGMSPSAMRKGWMCLILECLDAGMCPSAGQMCCGRQREAFGSCSATTGTIELSAGFVSSIFSASANCLFLHTILEGCGVAGKRRISKCQSLALMQVKGNNVASKQRSFCKQRAKCLQAKGKLFASCSTMAVTYEPHG
eukprot:1145477-Pelagomonas_calceolata.AAC.2